MINIYLIPLADRYQTPQEIARIYRDLNDDCGELAMYGIFRPSMVYYGRCHVRQCTDVEDVTQYLAAGDQAYMVISDEVLPELDDCQDLFEIIARRPNFPERGQLLLLRGRACVATNRDTTRR